MKSRLLVFASTVLRGTNGVLSGYIYSVDWHAKKIIKKVHVPSETGHRYWNARGGNRGGRGIALDGKNQCIYVATATQILKYSMDLNLVSSINHEYMAGIHEILFDGDGIWITSTVHDLVFKLGLDGKVQEEWWGSKSNTFRKKFGYSDRCLNLKLDFPPESFELAYNDYCSEEIFHINALALHNSSVYALSSTKRCLLQIAPVDAVVLQDNGLGHPHNVQIIEDGRALINDTRNQKLKIYDLYSGELDEFIDTPVSTDGLTSSQFSRPGWQRGLATINDRVCLVGSSPAQIIEVNLDRKLVGSSLVLEKDVRNCIHGLAAVEI